MPKTTDIDKTPPKILISQPEFFTEKYWNLVWKCVITIFICCLLTVLFGIRPSFIARFIGFQSTNTESDDTSFFVLKYETDVVDGKSLGAIDLYLLKNTLMKQWQLAGITIYGARFISSSIDDSDQTTNEIRKVDTFVVSLSIKNPHDCISIDCIKNSIAVLNQDIQLPITFMNGRIINVHLRFSSNRQVAEDEINQQNKPKYKRQASEPTHSETSNTSRSGSLLDIPKPIFFPNFIGNFQLALKSNTSIIVIIGNDRNIYLSAQYLSKTQPSTFALYDLQLTNQSAVALIQDASNNRYLHTYNDIQTNGYSRLRTHLDSYMPCGSNIMFWMFRKGYLQFYRGGEWAYDTAGCMDPLTGLVKIWLINGQQGLTALQTKYKTCGLAPLVPINYT